MSVRKSNPRLIIVSDDSFHLPHISGISDTDIEWVGYDGIVDLVASLDQIVSGHSTAFVLDCYRWNGLCDGLFEFPGVVYLEGCKFRDKQAVFDTGDMYQTLGLASYLGSKGWPTIVAARPAGVGYWNRVESMEGANDAVNCYKKLSQAPEFCFRLSVGEDRTKSVTDAVRAINALQCVGGRRFPVGPADAPFHTPKWEMLQDQCEAEEFESDEILQDIREWYPKGNYEPNAARMAFLNCTILTRNLATRFFERRACSVTVALVPEELVARYESSATIYRDSVLFDFQDAKRPTWFHLADSFLQDGGIETALAPSSLLSVQCDNGRVACLSEYRNDSPKCRGSRYAALAGLSHDLSVELKTKSASEPMVLAALAEGYVEVYRKGELVLWYDRFRWRYRPFERLRTKLDEFFGRDGDEQTLRVIAAISILMDAKESAILAFVDQSGRDAIDKLSGSQQIIPMRPEFAIESHPSDGAGESGFRTSLKESELHKMTPAFLASLLRMDGAHVVCCTKGNARIERLALHVQISAGDASSAAGTGRRAAELLAGHIGINSLVVKVSASGNLKIYSGGSPK